MSLFQLHDLSTAPPSSHALLNDLAGRDGQLPNMMRILAESPAALDAYMSLAERLSRCTLRPIEQQVVYLTAAHANACHYCTSPHPMLGVDEQARTLADAIRLQQPLQDARLQILRRFTAAMTTQRGWIPEEQVRAFLDAGFDRENLLEVILGISLATLGSYTNHLGATPVDVPPDSIHGAPDPIEALAETGLRLGH